MSKSKFVGNVLIITIYAIIAKVLSFVVELLLAVKFGANNQTDVFFMAYGIVQIIWPMITIGIWKVYMPEYKTRISLGRYNEAFSFTNKLLCVFLIIVTVISFMIIIYPPLIIRIFAPGFSPSKIAMCSSMFRILSVMFIFNTITTFYSVILQSHGYWGESQIKEIIQFVPPVIFLLFFTSWYGIEGVSVSIVVGAILSVFVAAYLTRKVYRFRFPQTSLFDKEIIDVLKSVPAACLNAVVNQINGIVDKAFSSGLVIGSLTYLNYGSRFIHLFDGLFSSAISIVLFPHMTELVAKREDIKLKALIRDYLLLILAIMIPVSIFIVAYSFDLIDVAFGYGKFQSGDVSETSMVLMMYAIGLPAMGITVVINDLFYIKKRANELLFTTVVCVVINVILDFLLIRQFGVAALALATSIAYYLALIIKFFMLREDVSIDKQIITSIFYISAISTIGIIVSQLVISLLCLHKIVKLITVFIIFFVVYMVLLISFSNYYRRKIISLVR